MDSIVARNWKKKVIFGFSLLLSIVAVIVFSSYATYRANANQLSAGLSAPEKANTRIDVKVENGLADPQGSISTTEPNNVAPGSNQQEVTNKTNQDVKVQVDGKPIEVPKNGSIHKEVTTESGSTSIDVSTQSNNSSSGNSRTRSSINIDVDSDSSVHIRAKNNSSP